MKNSNKLFYNLFRELELREIRKNILSNIRKYGRYEILEDKIICYVDKEKIKNKYSELLQLHGISKKDKGAKKCKLDKPVQYIIEGIKFTKNIEISSYYDAEIIFRNCTFAGSIKIDHASSIVFENNKYISKSFFSKEKQEVVCNQFWLSSRKNEVDSIKFINDNLFAFNAEKSKMNLYLFAKKIEFLNSNIDTNRLLLIDTKDLKITNSDINSNELYITSNNIECEKMKIKSKEGVIIESNDNNETLLNNIDSKNLFYNGRKIITSKNKVNSERNLLLEELRVLRENCNNICNNNVKKLKI